MYGIAYNKYMKKILYYKTSDGKCPYLDWYNSLDKGIKPYIAKRLTRVLEGNYGDHKRLNTDLSELRFKVGSGYRIYYSEFKDTIIILLCAGNKSGQQTDIKNANKYIEDYKERFSNE